ALVTAGVITQHVAFELLTILTLFALARFLRNRVRRGGDLTAALLGIAFATVEISVVLIGSALVGMAWFLRSGGLGTLSVLIARGAVWFAAALLLVWPMGFIHLNALKGYAYLAYIAIYRKTFNPIGPMDLWGFKLKAYPYEFILP